MFEASYRLVAVENIYGRHAPPGWDECECWRTTGTVPPGKPEVDHDERSNSVADVAVLEGVEWERRLAGVMLKGWVRVAKHTPARHAIKQAF